MSEEIIKRKKLLSVLGTTLYKPVCYGDSNEETPFVQMGIVNQYLDENDEVYIFLTEGERGSRQKNWHDRKYTKDDIEKLYGKEKAKTETDIKIGDIHKGLQRYLKESEVIKNENIHDVSIPDCKSEEEIWDCFKAIYDVIDDGDIIIFDITHSFRSIPLLVMAIVNLAKVTKNITVSGIYYGAYEARENNRAPIIDLSSYNMLVDMTNAAKVFSKFGYADEMIEIVEREENNLREKDLRNFCDNYSKTYGELRKIANSMKELSDSLITCRGYHKGRFKYSIKNQYERMKTRIKDSGQKIDGKERKKYFWIFDIIQNSFKRFEKEENYEIGLSVVEWSIENNMIQQGFTALEETIKTFLCYILRIDPGNEGCRDAFIGWTLSEVSKSNNGGEGCFDEIGTIKDSVKESIINIYREKCEGEKRFQDVKEYIEVESEKEIKDIQRKLLNLMNKDFITMVARVKDYRNDINHFGFRTNPMSPVAFEKNLENSKLEFENQIDRILNTYQN